MAKAKELRYFLQSVSLYMRMIPFFRFGIVTNLMFYLTTLQSIRHEMSVPEDTKVVASAVCQTLPQDEVDQGISRQVGEHSTTEKAWLLDNIVAICSFVWFFVDLADNIVQVCLHLKSCGK